MTHTVCQVPGEKCQGVDSTQKWVDVSGPSSPRRGNELPGTGCGCPGMTGWDHGLDSEASSLPTPRHASGFEQARGTWAQLHVPESQDSSGGPVSLGHRLPPVWGDVGTREFGQRKLPKGTTAVLLAFNAAGHQRLATLSSRDTQPQCALYLCLPMQVGQVTPKGVAGRWYGVLGDSQPHLEPTVRAEKGTLLAPQGGNRHCW